MAGWGQWGQSRRDPEQRRQVQSLPCTCTEWCEHTRARRVHRMHTCTGIRAGSTRVATAHTLWGGAAGRRRSPDTAVSVVCGGQLQGQPGGHRWSRGQRLLLENELRSQVHLCGAHHDLRSREQGRLPLVVVLQHLGTGRGSWWRWRGDNHVWRQGSRPGLSGPAELHGVSRACSPPHTGPGSSG